MVHILITGASSGIGAALALRYATSGTRLSLHGRSDARLKEVAAEAVKKGAEVNVTMGDVTDAVAMDAWVKTADQIQPIDLVIANAGISGGTFGGPKDIDAVAKIFAVNLSGVLNTLNPALAIMTARGKGQVVIMSSLASFRGLAGSSAYSSSKAAVRVYGEALRADLGPKGIKVNVICPGFIKTPMTDVNPFPMPFLITPDQASAIIESGLAENRPRIAFPLPMYALVRFMAMLPQDWINHYVGKRFRKLPFDG